jgi:amidohydrolase
MDALPEVGHACGHNIIATAALGAGVALAPLAAELGVRITVLGTPAEEHMGGKMDLIEAGAFSGVDAALMIHPWSGDLVDKRFLAVAHFDVEFHGKEAHASSSPQLGINALDAAVQAYVNVSTLRQSLLPTDQMHGIIKHGGSAPNVIPPYTAMSWYARAPSGERMQEVMDKMITCFEAAALATGCSFEVHQQGHTYTDLVPDETLARLYAENSAAVGRPMELWRKEDHGFSGSTDMGNVSHEVPSLHPMLDIKAAPAVNHQRDFAAHTVSPTGELAIRDGALAMAWTVVDLAVGDRWAELGASQIT